MGRAIIDLDTPAFRFYYRKSILGDSIQGYCKSGETTLKQLVKQLRKEKRNFIISEKINKFNRREAHITWWKKGEAK